MFLKHQISVLHSKKLYSFMTLNHQNRLNNFNFFCKLYEIQLEFLSRFSVVLVEITVEKYKFIEIITA